jgi:hypothetical protein
VSPAVRGARPPGEAPQPFCERCGTSVEVAKLGPWVGLCHCPSCDTYSCRWCWAEAAEACPECGAVFGETLAAAPPATEALVASSPTTEALAAGTLAANALVAEKLAVEETQAVPPAGEAPATTDLTSKRVPVGIGVAVLAVALVALILGNPFGSGGVGTEVGPTSSPGGPTSAGGGPRSPSPDADPTSASSIDPGPTATDDTAQPAGGSAPTPRPTATPTARPGATATPQPPGPTPTPRITPAPTPRPTPTPTSTAAPTPEPSPACTVVPDLVSMTVAKARGAWRGAGFTGAFTADGGGKQIVATQSQPAGACLPPGTAIAVTT